MTNNTSTELLGVGIKILEGMAFLSSNSLTADATTMLLSSQRRGGGGVGGSAARLVLRNVTLCGFSPFANEVQRVWLCYGGPTRKGDRFRQQRVRQVVTVRLGPLGPHRIVRSPSSVSGRQGLRRFQKRL